MSTVYSAAIAAAAAKYGLSAELLERQVLVESGANPWAWNPEPRYRYLWNVRSQRPFRAITADEGASEYPPNDFPTLSGDRDQEWWGQQASWGLMQLMGAVAREYGFRAPYLTQLCEPAINLEIGAAVMSRLLKWAGGDIARALAAYNAGEGGWRSADAQLYVSKVMSGYTPSKGVTV